MTDPIVQAIVHRRSLIGKESTNGTAVDATVDLGALAFTSDAPQYTSQAVEVMGKKYAVSNIQGARHTTGSVEGFHCYRASTYLWATALRDVSPTTPGGATNTRRWTFAPVPAGKDTIATYTAQWGDNEYTSSSSYLALTELSLETAATDSGFQVGGSWIAQDTQRDTIRYLDIDSGATGDFELTVQEVAVTEPIAYDANDATIEAALNALINIGASGVSVSSLAVTFDGTALAATDVALLEVIDDTTDTGVTVAETTPGDPSGPTDEVQTISTNSATEGRYRLRFTHTYTTASTLAVTETAANVETALETLVPVNSGDVVVSGGPLGTAPIKILYTGRYADTATGRELYSARPVIDVDNTGLSGGTAAITRLYPGELTVIDPIPIEVEDTNVWFASAHTDLTTNDDETATCQVYGLTFSASDLRGSVFCIKRDRGSYSSLVDLKPGTEVMLRVGTSLKLDLAPYLETKKHLFVLIDSVSNELVEAGFPFSQQIYLCCQLQSVSEPTDEEGIAVYEMTGILSQDATWGKVIEVIVDNDLTTL